MKTIDITLMHGTLSIDSIKYNKQLSQTYPRQVTLQITTPQNHGIIGKVKVNLANCQVFNVNGISDYFNTQNIEFRVTGFNTLEASLQWNTGDFDLLPPSYDFIDLPNNGSTITIAVNQPSYNLNAGLYTFRVLENFDIEAALDTAKFQIKQEYDNGLYLSPIEYTVAGEDQVGFNGNITNGSNIITNVTDITSLSIDQGIVALGIPIGSVITAIGSTSVTISNNATQTTPNHTIKAQYTPSLSTKCKQIIQLNGTQNSYYKNTLLSIINYSGRQTKLPLIIQASN
jgi:hypothetical protein